MKPVISSTSEEAKGPRCCPSFRPCRPGEGGETPPVSPCFISNDYPFSQMSVLPFLPRFCCLSFECGAVLQETKRAEMIHCPGGMPPWTKLSLARSPEHLLFPLLFPNFPFVSLSRTIFPNS